MIVKAPFCENKTLLTSRKGVIKMCIFYCAICSHLLFSCLNVQYITQILKNQYVPNKRCLANVQMYSFNTCEICTTSYLPLLLRPITSIYQFINYSVFHQNNSFPIIVGKSINFNMNLRPELFQLFVNPYKNGMNYIHIPTRLYLVISALATLILACSSIRRKQTRD